MAWGNSNGAVWGSRMNQKGQGLVADLPEGDKIVDLSVQLGAVTTQGREEDRERGGRTSSGGDLGLVV